ncbi:putative serine/threonine-protein kinase [Toxocara canis]|uniref:Putative serine/threonine-protein kinase n=2 Tax=Toxocara canis TaxID=6265 RepID=A0A0B2VGU7_TOXCA|nr:putative serine/threonine-protein kinase [Toxocara canis]VDM46142.1 unnamed protein product [Toxocara canis]
MTEKVAEGGSSDAREGSQVQEDDTAASGGVDTSKNKQESRLSVSRAGKGASSEEVNKPAAVVDPGTSEKQPGSTAPAGDAGDQMLTKTKCAEASQMKTESIENADQAEKSRSPPAFHFEKLRLLTERLFRSTQVFPLRTWTLFSQLRQKRLVVDQWRLVGEFFNLEDNGEWRVIGMRGTRNDIASIEYDVLRLSTRKIGINCTAFPEATTTANNDHILKICNSDSSRTHALFMNQYKLLKRLSATYRSFRIRKHFPKVFGCGAFEELCYKEKLTSDEMVPKLLIYFPQPNPRPYFIQEKVEPTLEEVARMARSGALSVHLCGDVIIGCIMALRLLHRIGYVHRCVAPYNFAIRLDAFRLKYPIAEQICLIDFTLCRKIKGPNGETEPRRVTSFAGTYKYCSVAALLHKEQCPSDDIISCVHMLCEFLFGALPWKGVRNLKKLIELKLSLQADVMIVTEKALRVPVDPSQLQDVFRLLEDVLPYTGELPYQKLYKKLHSMTAIDEKPGNFHAAHIGLRAQSNADLAKFLQTE